MANSRICFALHGFDDAFGHNCYAMPISLGREACSAISFMLPFFIVTNEVSVPISRGRPPGLLVRA